MSSKESILAAIQGLKMEEKPLPDIPEFEVAEDLVEAFTKALIANKGTVASKEEIDLLISETALLKIIALHLPLKATAIAKCRSIQPILQTWIWRLLKVNLPQLRMLLFGWMIVI